MSSKYYIYKKHDKTIDDYINLGILKGIEFNQDLFDHDTNKGNQWRCKNNHDFKASYTKVSTDKFICKQCINDQYDVDINIGMIRAIIKAIFFQTRRSNTFSRKTPKCLIKEPVYHRRIMSGYEPSFNLGFIFISPQSTHFIPRFHKSISSVEKEEEKLSRTLNICKISGVNIILVPYYIKKDDLFQYIINNLREFGYTIGTNEECMDRFMAY